MRSKIFGALLAACAIAAAVAAPAGAVVAETPSGPVGYLPLNGQGPGQGGAGVAGLAAPKGAAAPHREPPLLYHGGPVMHSHKAYLIFWVPSGGTYSLPTGYQAGIETYLQNVAADSGKPSNVYSVSAQYSDGTGHASYSDSYGGSTTDTHAYPFGPGTCAPYTGFNGETYSACITDEKLEDEVESVVAAQGWPKTLAAEYYVVLPPHAGSCFDDEPGEEECFDLAYCAYHSYSEPEKEIYANISYAHGDVPGCGVGEYPNGPASGNVDDTLSSFSHEANESITDPTLEAWFDKKKFENGDECRNPPPPFEEEEFGDPLGGSEVEETLFNQAIGSGHYFLQQEWSNDIEACAQRVKPASPAISAPSSVAPGEAASFDGGGSVPGAGGIVSYHWEFGDGDTADGPSVSHSYASAGVFTVTLTVKDDGGFSYAITHQVTVASPVSAIASTIPTVTPASPRKRLKCRKGFKKAKRHGKAVCVKVKKHHRHHKHH